MNRKGRSASLPTDAADALGTETVSEASAGNGRPPPMRLILRLLRIWALFYLFYFLCGLLYIYSFHRIRTPRDVLAMLATLRLPLLDDRCRTANATHCVCLPNVFFIGASKGGTTSITEYLSMHPRVHFVKRRIFPDKHREVHRFDRNTYGLALRGIDLLDEWASSPATRSPNDAVIHYTPHYLYAPSVPFDLAAFYPQPDKLKFVVILRDPVERALSSYWFQNSHLFHDADGGSMADFERLIKVERGERDAYEKCMTARVRAEGVLGVLGSSSSLSGLASSLLGLLDPFLLLTTRAPPLRSAHSHRPKSPLFDRLEECFGSLFRSSRLGGRHLDKGVYVDQLQRWFSQFPRENFFITSTKRFYSGPGEYLRLLAFIGAEAEGAGAGGGGQQGGVQTKILAALMSRNSSRARLVSPNALAFADPPSARLLQSLQDFYRSHNERLRAFLGVDLFL